MSQHEWICRDRRARLLRSLESLLSVEEVLVVPFGSYVTDTDIASSDVDVAVLFSDFSKSRSERVDQLAQLLEASKLFAQIMCNRAGRFPTIRLLSTGLGASVAECTADLVVHDGHGVVGTWLIESLLKSAPFARTLGKRVKDWAKQVNVSGSAKGNYPSIVFTVFVLGFLQTKNLVPRIQFSPGSVLGRRVDDATLIDLVFRGVELCQLHHWVVVSPTTAPTTIPPFETLYRECLEFILLIVEGILVTDVNLTCSVYDSEPAPAVLVRDPVDGRNMAKALGAVASGRLLTALHTEVERSYAHARQAQRQPQ